MKNLFLLSAVSLSFGLLLASKSLQAQSIILTTEELPPFNYTDPKTGEIVGENVEKVRKIMAATKLGYEIRMLPWARAYQMALDLKNVCVFTTVYTQSRKDIFKWILPLSKDDWTLLSYQKISDKVQTLDDVRKFRIGGYGADARTNFLINNGFNVDVSTDEASNLRKLKAGRIDMFVHQRPTGVKIDTYDIAGEKIQLHEVLNFGTVESGIACNKGMDEDLFDKMLSAWQRIK